MVLCAYVDMLNLEDHMKGHKFFRQAAQLAIEVRNLSKQMKFYPCYHLDLYSAL